MTPEAGGPLGPVAARRLRRIAEEVARLDQDRMEVLLLVAEAQGHAPPDGAVFSWDLGADPPVWRLAAPAVDPDHA